MRPGIGPRPHTVTPGNDARSSATTQSDLLRDVIDVLESSGVDYRVLNGYQGYPDVIPSDIDLLVPDPVALAQQLADRGVARLVQAVRYESTSYCFVLYRHTAHGPVYLLVDASADFRDQGRIFLGGAEILSGVRRYRSFATAAPDIEYVCYLIKKLMKGDLNGGHGVQLTELYREDPSACALRLRRFFPPREVKLILYASQSGIWDTVRAHHRRLRRVLLRRVLRRRPLHVLRYWAGESARAWGRVRHPDGLVLVFFGPDGAGKSTVARLVERRLAPAFRTTRRYHLRPHFGGGGNEGPAVQEPHAQRPRRLVSSLAKLVLWWADYQFSYLFHIMPRVVRARLVVFDRHFLDLNVDPVRYRFGGPLWLARAVGRLIPSAGTLFFYLDAPAHVVRERKVELPVDEIERQRRAYLQLIAGLPQGYVVDASGSAEKVADEIVETVLTALSIRTARRLGLRVPDASWSGSPSASPDRGS